MPPDARKHLTTLRTEWESCTRCELGQRRIQVGGHFVFGTGVPRAVMLVGEGPGAEEEKHGEPFMHKDGVVLRKVLAKLGLHEYYMTTLVTCRSCELQLDGDGHPMERKVGWGKGARMELVYKDQPPTVTQWKQCLARLHEEIYLVDPVVVVGLGGTVSKALLGDNIAITRERGEDLRIRIPGASFVPSLTDKKRDWLRKKKDHFELPVEPNEVEYLFIPTLHPSYVVRKAEDRGHDSPLRQFVKDLRKVVGVYEEYMMTVFGRAPTAPAVSDEEVESTYNESE